MQLVPKKINGHTYWYLIRKGRKNGVPTNIETIYLGKPDRIAELLGLAMDPDNDDAFPVGSQSREVGASAALWCEVEQLGLVELIDNVLSDCNKGRRSDAAVSYGELLVTMAIQRTIAPRSLKSLGQLQRWYEGAGLNKFLSLQSTGLDTRRVDEAISRLKSADLCELEAQIVERAIGVHKVSLEKLTFDATNFDSYVAAGTKCSLLKRGNAKSKKKNLRILGLGMLVSADGDIPLLSFPYPGNKPDVKSFRSFLRRLKARGNRLLLDKDSTIAFDGGNISKDVVQQLDAASLHFVARLPGKHANEATAIETRELPWLKGTFAGLVRAKKLRVNVYGVERTVVAVFSKSMRESQVPGIQRDIRRAKEELTRLNDRLERQRAGVRHKPINLSQTRAKVLMALDREHLMKLFRVTVEDEEGFPALDFEFDEQAWEHLHENCLGRTLILASRDRWSARKIVDTLREQSHVENSFRQMKDAEWAALTPLRHYRNRTLRVHTFVGVIGLLLATLLVRRLRKGGMKKATVSNSLYELSELRMTKLSYSGKAPARLKALAKRFEIVPTLNPIQRKMLGILKSTKRLVLGPTAGKVKCPS